MAATATSVLNRLIQNATRLKKLSESRRATAPPTSAITTHLNSGDLHQAVSILASSAAPFPASVYARLLQLCAVRRALIETRRVESHIVAFSPSPSTFLLNRAIETYGVCDSLNDARELFDEMPHRDGGTWNAMISSYARSDHAEEVLSLFSRMSRSGIRPNDITFASVLGCCADLLALYLARQIHALVWKFGFCLNVILGTSLVDAYGKCWLLDDAQKIFDSIPSPNAVSWNVIVRRYLEVGRGDEAVLMFFLLISTGVKPLNFTVSNALCACSDILGLREGCQIHGIAVKIGCEGDNIVESSLGEMYAKCGAIEDARRLFDQSTLRDVVSWTSMVSGYASCGRFDEAELLFEEMSERNVVSWNAMLAGYVQFFCWDKALAFILWMQRETKEIDIVTLSLILNVCAGISDLELGKQVHAFAHRHGFSTNLFFSNALLDMYAKCGNLRSAELWFIQLASQRDRISWNSLLSGYARKGRSDESLSAFREMQLETTPSELTFTALLAACANIFMVEHGKQIHGYIIRNGFKMDEIIKGALIDMYSKCRLIEYAIKVFKEESSTKDIVIWNSMILGCAHNGRGEYGVELFEMMQKDGIRPDNVTFIGVLLACISEGYVNLGQRYFCLMSDECGVIPRIEHYECMIELLGKHGFMVELEDFIQRMPFEPTIPMWTRIFDCCRDHGNSRLGEKAAKCINEANPLNPVSFELFNGATSDTSETSNLR